MDEPDEPYMDEIILAWAKPIREADTGVRIWVDVTHQDMNEADQDMIDACHVLSPNYSAFLRPTAAAEIFLCTFLLTWAPFSWIPSCIRLLGY